MTLVPEMKNAYNHPAPGVLNCESVFLGTLGEPEPLEWATVKVLSGRTQTTQDVLLVG
jgi:hypothetical protein